MTLLLFHFLFRFEGVAVLNLTQNLLHLLSAYLGKVFDTDTDKFLEGHKGNIMNYFKQQVIVIT